VVILQDTLKALLPQGLVLDLTEHSLTTLKAWLPQGLVLDLTEHSLTTLKVWLPQGLVLELTEHSLTTLKACLPQGLVVDLTEHSLTTLKPSLGYFSQLNSERLFCTFCPIVFHCQIPCDDSGQTERHLTATSVFP
jgi:hypothetical protein